MPAERGLGYILYRQERRAREPLTGMALVDVGCGGGLLSEALARLGAHVTGIDASEAAVAVATAHAAEDPLLRARTQYRNATAEQLLEEGECGLSYPRRAAPETCHHHHSRRQLSWLRPCMACMHLALAALMHSFLSCGDSTEGSRQRHWKWEKVST